jgi:hypothetical protein
MRDDQSKELRSEGRRTRNHSSSRDVFESKRLKLGLGRQLGGGQRRTGQKRIHVIRNI